MFFFNGIIRFKLILCFSLISLLICLSGCANYCCFSKVDRASIDWYGLGVEDGKNGFQRNVYCELKDSCDDCQKQSAAVSYQAGWDEGVRCFCTPQQGYEIGSAGLAYPGFCPADLAGPFRAAWYHGIKCYYTPELGCGEGCARTYCSPPIECRSIKSILTSCSCP